MELIAKDIATKEVNDWLNNLDVSEDRRHELQSNMNIMVDALMSGRLTINPDTNVVTYKLRFPFGKEIKITELKFKTELTVGEVNSYKKSIDFEDDNRNTTAAVCASTCNLYSVVMQLNTRDYNTAVAIVVFFMV